MKPHTDIQRLIDSYMAGTTTDEDEARLRAYFAHYREDIDGPLPPQWQVYSALFGYIDSQRAAIGTPHRSAAIRRTPTRRWWAVAASAAAIIVLGAVLLWPRHTDSAYAVIDGRVCTTPSEVKAQALSALQTITIAPDDEAFSAINQLSE